MSFAELAPKGTFGHDRIVSRVAISSAGVQSTGINVILSGDVHAKIGNPPFVKVLAGTGEHRGMLLIRPTFGKTDGGYTLGIQNRKNGGKYSHQRLFAISASRIGVKKGKFPVTPVDFQVTDEGLVVTLPKDLLAPAAAAVSPKYELLKKAS